MRKKSFAIVIVTFVMAAFICMISGFINMKLLYTKAGADMMLSDTFRSIKLTPFEQKALSIINMTDRTFAAIKK